LLFEIPIVDSYSVDSLNLEPTFKSGTLHRRDR
jgi:hypothetical protein